MHQEMEKTKWVLIVCIIFALILELAVPQAAFAASKKKVKSVSFTNVGTYLTLKKGQKKTLKVSVKPKKDNNKKVKFKSSRPSVVSVSKKGVIKAKRKGTAYITVTARDGSKKRDRVKVTVGTKVSSVKYTNVTSTYVMKKGAKKTFKVSIKPSNASNKRISWSSSKSSVASVSSKGVVKAKKKGTAYITAKARDGSGKYARYKVIVGTKISKISVSGQNYIGKGGSKIKLTAKVSPGSASYKSVTWKSSNTSIAKVNSSGTITGVREGTATITASAKDGTGKKGSFKINVVLPSQSSAMFVGHRGYSSIAPENTIAAFNEAVRYSFGGIECDVWQTKGNPQETQEQAEKKAASIARATPEGQNTVPYAEDKTEKTPQAAKLLQENQNNEGEGGEGGDKEPPKEIPGLMIMHDQNLLKMCGVNKLITDLTPLELSNYPIKNGTNIHKYQTQVIPSYGQYLETFIGNGTTPVIEIKSRTPRTADTAIDETAAEELLKQLKQADLKRNVVFQSFNIISLQRVMEAAKKEEYAALDLTFLYLTSSEAEVDSSDLEQYRDQGISGICINRNLATPSIIQNAKAYGLKVGVWTVDDTTLAYRLAEIDHVDYVISNKKVFK